MRNRSYSSVSKLSIRLPRYLEIPSHLTAPNYKADMRQGVAVEYASCEPTESARELFDENCEPIEEEQ
jgi:hypothetical protein